MENDKNKDNHEPDHKEPEENNNDDNNNNEDNELSYEKLTNEITKLREENAKLEKENQDIKKAYNNLYERGSFHEREKDKPVPRKKLSYDDIII